ncbi:MAG: sodium:solute symporter, partial [Thermoplasmata archaeon]
LRMSTALLPIYGIGLAFIALFGVLIYAVSPAMAYISKFPAADRGVYVVPALIMYTMPSWFAGFAFLGIFIGGLVPAAIMAIASGNLFTRNIGKYIFHNMNAKKETNIAKWATVVFVFIALAFTFTVPETYAIQLQLLGGIIILQLLPSIFLGLYIPKLNKHSLIAGWAVGLITGIYMVEVANKFGPLTTSFYPVMNNLIFIGILSVSINVAIAIAGSLIASSLGIRNNPVKN